MGWLKEFDYSCTQLWKVKKNVKLQVLYYLLFKKMILLVAKKTKNLNTVPKSLGWFGFFV